MRLSEYVTAPTEGGALMRWLLYGMIGLGFIVAKPYSDLPVAERAFVYLAWPAVMTRDIINNARQPQPRELAQ